MASVTIDINFQKDPEEHNSYEVTARIKGVNAAYRGDKENAADTEPPHQACQWLYHRPDAMAHPDPNNNGSEECYGQGNRISFWELALQAKSRQDRFQSSTF
jgi:hypothetical protein